MWNVTSRLPKEGFGATMFRSVNRALKPSLFSNHDGDFKNAITGDDDNDYQSIVR